MAHERIGKQSNSITLNFSKNSIEAVKAAIEMTEEELVKKCDEFCWKMAELGEEYAKMELYRMDAIDTGFLFNSIDIKPGDVWSTGSSWIIYTDCDYAEYVEYGTGTEGAKDPHPSGQGWYNQDMSNKVRNPYNKSDTRLGWFYGGTWTAGMGSRPFMWNTWEYLKMDRTIREVAKEVFG